MNKQGFMTLSGIKFCKYDSLAVENPLSFECQNELTGESVSSGDSLAYHIHSSVLHIQLCIDLC